MGEESFVSSLTLDATVKLFFSCRSAARDLARGCSTRAIGPRRFVAYGARSHTLTRVASCAASCEASCADTGGPEKLRTSGCTIRKLLCVCVGQWGFRHRPHNDFLDLS